MLFNPISILDKFFKREDEDCVALDLGAAYLKGLLLSHGEIKDFFVVENKGSPVKLAADELRKRGWPGKKVRVAIKGNDTLIRYITFPKVDSKNIREIFSYEISKFVPFKKEDIYFDVFILDNNYSAGNFLILAAAAKKKFIDLLIESFNNENISIENITLNNTALLNLYLNAGDKELNTAVIDVGFGSTLLNLFKKGMPRLSREIKVSAGDLAHKLAKVKNIKIDEARHIIVTLDEDRSITQVQEIIEVIEDVGLELSEEIKNSLDYFEVNWGERIDNILITGGLSTIRGIDKIVENSLGISVRLWDPFAYRSLDKAKGAIKKVKPSFAVVLGMSI